MPYKKLLYRPARLSRGKIAAALDLTPRALGWERIHFAVRHLRAGAVWVGPSRDEERCLVLLRGEAEGLFRGTIRRLVGESPSAWRVRQWNPRRDSELARSEWPKADRVVGKYNRK